MVGMWRRIFKSGLRHQPLNVTCCNLTNTYFEGSGKFNEFTANGKSKEKRSDCPLVILGLVLDSRGFTKRSEVFSGNVSEPLTLEQMIKGLQEGLCHQPADQKQQQLIKKSNPTVVLDADIATEDNIKWLRANGYRYLVVSRKRHREFSIIYLSPCWHIIWFTPSNTS